MEDFSRILLGETRRHPRVQENARLVWRIKEGNLVGHGRVRNISTSGMLIELTSVNTIPDQSIFSFDSNLNDANYIPEAGQLAWCRRKGFARNTQLCGVQFADMPEVILARLRKRVEEGIRQFVKSLRINTAVGRALSLVSVALILYAAWLGAGVYQNLSQSNARLLAAGDQQAALTREYQGLYAETVRRLAEVTLELNETTALYQQSQQDLQAARQEVAVLQSVLSQTELLLTQARNQSPMQQAATSQSAPAASQAAQAQVSNIAEGQALIAEYKDWIRAVRSQLSKFRHQAYLDKIAQLQERDRIRMVLGNKGYLVREGQTVQVDTEQYRATSFNAPSAPRSPRADSKIKVDVTIFQQ